MGSGPRRKNTDGSIWFFFRRFICILIISGIPVNFVPNHSENQSKPNTMRTTFIIFLLFCGIFNAAAQQGGLLKEGEPLLLDGIEYGFTISNVSEKAVGDKGNYSRFEVDLYATNKGACPRIIPVNEGNQDNTELGFARFDCTNATGFRLTSKNATIALPQFFQSVRVLTAGQSGKTQFGIQRLMTGFGIRPWETLRRRVVVIVPLNEQPQIKVSLLTGFME